MRKSKAKSRKVKKNSSALDASKILMAMRRDGVSPKKPTSIALDERTIADLKSVADKQGLPYQVLIRVFILDGLERFKNGL